MTQEQVEDLVRTILLEKKGWAERLPIIREEMKRLSISQFDLTSWLREQGVRTGRGPVSNDTVGRWLRGTTPDADAQDAIVDMLVEASMGKWSKARFLSWHRVVDAIRPTRTPRRALRRLTLVGVTLTLALGLITNTALAASSDYGPGLTGVGATSPTYSPPIPVIDTLAPTLTLEHRRIWRKARNAALADWGTGCVSFTVSTGLATWDDSVGILGFANLVTPGTISLFNNQSSFPQDMGGWDEATQAGLATYLVWKPWWKDYYRSQLEGTIGHEIGHALGFGHGGSGIMAGQTDRPNATDLALLRSYYC